MKPYKFTWTESVECTATVMADGMDEAVQKLEFGDYYDEDRVTFEETEPTCEESE